MPVSEKEQQQINSLLARFEAPTGCGWSPPSWQKPTLVLKSPGKRPRSARRSDRHNVTTSHSTAGDFDRGMEDPGAAILPPAKPAMSQSTRYEKVNRHIKTKGRAKVGALVLGGSSRSSWSSGGLSSDDGYSDGSGSSGGGSTCGSR